MISIKEKNHHTNLVHVLLQNYYISYINPEFFFANSNKNKEQATVAIPKIALFSFPFFDMD